MQADVVSAPTGTAHYDADPVVERYRARTESGPTAREDALFERHFTRFGAPTLDLGCGTGRTTGALAERGLAVVGVDLSRSMLAAFREFHPDVACAVGDATDLPFDDAAFEYVLFSYNGIDAIHPDTTRVAALREVHRVLRPDGLFVFSTRNRLRRLLPLPPTPAGVRSFVDFWRRNARAGYLGSPYKLHENSLTTARVYHSSPRRQRRQLDRAGFDTVDVVGRGGPLSRTFGPSLYFVARRRP